MVIEMTDWVVEAKNMPLETSKPVEIADGVIRLLAPNPSVMTGPGTNTYLLALKGGVAVIDPGPDDEKHIEAISQASTGLGPIKWIIATHAHIDHSQLVPKLALATNAQILSYGKRDEIQPTRELANGEIIRFDDDGLSLEVIHTPGHASDHLCFFHKGLKLLFTGDHIMEGSTVVIAPKDGDMTEYLESLNKVLERTKTEIDVLAPGHGQLLDNPGDVITYLIAHRLHRENLVLESLKKVQSATISNLLASVYSDVDKSLYPIATYSLWAHLRKLRQDGLAFSEDPDSIESVWKSQP